MLFCNYYANFTTTLYTVIVIAKCLDAAEELTRQMVVCKSCKEMMMTINLEPIYQNTVN